MRKLCQLALLTSQYKTKLCSKEIVLLMVVRLVEMLIQGCGGDIVFRNNYATSGGGVISTKSINVELEEIIFKTVA